MIDRESATTQLAALLEQHIDEVADAWAQMTYQNASFRPSDSWIDMLRTSAKQGLEAIIETLKTGSYISLKVYLSRLNIVSLKSGFKSSEVTESLLLCKDAIMEVISSGPIESSFVWAMIYELDACLRWIVGHFNTIAAAELNRCLRQQHENIIAMLNISEQATDSIDINVVLEHVAEGIMAAAHVEHCDFYIVDEDRNRLIPTVGTSHSPRPEKLIQAFLNYYPSPTSDPFYQLILEHKQPLVCENAQTDPRVNQAITSQMGTKSILSVPLVANHKVFAIVTTGTFSEYRTFTDEQLELTWDIARAAALVVENAGLHQQNRYMAALEERERLAREIHDNLAQALSILKLQASNIAELIRRGHFDQAQIFAADMVRTASEAHTDAREAITSLRTSVSTVSELMPTIEAYLDKFRKTYSMDVHLAVQDDCPLVLPPTSVVQLTRVIQEALANVRKHAKAHAVSINLQHDTQHLYVTIEDDGQGFEFSKIVQQENGGVGLQIMRERAESLGGHLKIDARPGKGTRIIAQIPL